MCQLTSIPIVAQLKTSKLSGLKMSQIYQYLRHFKRSEFSNPDAMSTELLLKLDWARNKAETPFILTSTFRLNDPRTHGKGLAVDILCTNSKTRLTIMKALLEVDFNRIGIYAEHIHVDVSATLPPCLWHGTYISPPGEQNA